MYGLPKWAKEDNQEKGVGHKKMIWRNDGEGSVLGERDGRGWSKVRGCEGG